MADNTFDGLAKAYQDFSVPAVKVLLGGKNLAEDLGARLQRAEVDLKLREESRALVEIWDCYDEENHTIASKLKTVLTPGSKLEISFGYQSSFGKVFSGYLDTVRLCLDENEGYTLHLEAYDVIRLMKRYRHSRMFQKDTHSAIFGEVMGSYSWLCKHKEDKTEAIPEGEVRMQDGDDYQFVTTELAGAENPGMEFFVKLGTAYFVKRTTGPSDVIALKPDQGVREITASWGFLNQKIRVQGCDGQHTVFTAAEEVAADTLDPGAGKGEDFQCVPYLDSQEKVNGWAAARGKSMKDDQKRVRLAVIGFPALLAGEFMRLAGFDSLVNGQYRILRADHILDEAGYRTEAELGGG